MKQDMKYLEVNYIQEQLMLLQRLNQEVRFIYIFYYGYSMDQYSFCVLFTKKKIRTDLGIMIDTIIQATLCKEDYILREQPRQFIYPNIIDDINELKKRGRKVASHCQFHEHKSRCRKPSGGKEKYDLGRTYVQIEHTVFDQIKLKETEPGTIPIKIKEREVIKIEIIDSPPTVYPNSSNHPLPEQDERIIEITLKRLTQE